MKWVILIACAGLFLWFISYMMEQMQSDAVTVSHRADDALIRRSNTIRIALVDPCVVDSVSKRLQPYAKANRKMEFSFWFGSPSELVHALNQGTVDLVLLPAGNRADIPAGYRVYPIAFTDRTIATDESRIPVEPLKAGRSEQLLVCGDMCLPATESLLSWVRSADA